MWVGDVGGGCGWGMRVGDAGGGCGWGMRVGDAGGGCGWGMRNCYSTNSALTIEKSEQGKSLKTEVSTIFGNIH